MKTLKTKRTILEPFSGASIFDCKVEAVIYSAENRTDVEFTFNDTVYEVLYNNVNALAKKKKA